MSTYLGMKKVCNSGSCASAYVIESPAGNINLKTTDANETSMLHVSYQLDSSPPNCNK